jgi:isopenicillin N synthase-like dioxygenase
VPCCSLCLLFTVSNARVLLDIIIKLLGCCRILCKKVSRLLALALNLEETYFDKPGITDDPIATLRLLHYSGQSYHDELVFIISLLQIT